MAIVQAQVRRLRAVASAEVGVESGRKGSTVTINATSLLCFFPSSILHGARSIVVVEDNRRRRIGRDSDSAQSGSR